MKSYKIILAIFIVLIAAAGSLVVGYYKGQELVNIISNKNDPINIPTGEKAQSPLQDKDENNEQQREEQQPEPVICIKAGSSIDLVKDVQHKLNGFGFQLQEDGNYGPMTVYSVSCFQKIIGLEETGIVDGNTYKRLSETPSQDIINKIKASKDEYIYKLSSENLVNSRNLKSSSGYMIYVDLKNQRVNIFTGTAYHWQLSRSMTCASGKSSTPTVRGTFSVLSKGPIFRVKNSNIYCKYYTRFYGNYLFHSVLLDGKGRVVDGTLGKQASHGCIRLAIENAKYIYDTIPMGTTVWIN